MGRDDTGVYFWEKGIFSTNRDEPFSATESFLIGPDGLSLKSYCLKCGIEHTVLIDWREVTFIAAERNPSLMGGNDWPAHFLRREITHRDSTKSSVPNLCLRPPVFCERVLVCEDGEEVCGEQVNVWLSAIDCRDVLDRIDGLSDSFADEVRSIVENTRRTFFGYEDHEIDSEDEDENKADESEPEDDEEDESK